jgi:hypothetical protein
MDVKSLLEKLDASLLSEEVAKEIAEAFETAVNEKVENRVSLQLEKMLSEQDEDHAEKLKKLLEAIDSDHSDKLQKVVNAINENHATKLEELVSFYRKALNEKAENFSNKIINEISNYLDLYIDKLIPQEQLQEAVNNVYAKKQLDSIRGMLGIDSSFISEQVKNTISEGKSIIDDLNSKLQQTKKENGQLLEKIETIQTNMILEEKTRNMNKTKKDFIVKLLGDKNKSYIEENFNYVVEMFDAGEDEKTTELAADAKKRAFSSNAKVPTSSVISESNTSSNLGNTQVGGYLSELKKSEGYSKNN